MAVTAKVVLDGAGSSDVEGDPLSYSWALLTRPAGSGAALSSAASVRPSFTADVAGTYVAQLTVSDGDCDSAPDTVIVTTENARPVADAGRDQTAGLGGVVTLDGTGSADANGDALSWKWALLSLPNGSAARLANPTAAQPTFTADLAGTYVAQLIVSDGTQSSHADTVVGAILSFLIDYRDVGLQAGAMAAQLFKAGSTVGFERIESPAKIKISIDMKTAEKLGIQISAASIQQASEVIR